MINYSKKLSLLKKAGLLPPSLEKADLRSYRIDGRFSSHQKSVLSKAWKKHGKIAYGLSKGTFARIAIRTKNKDAIGRIEQRYTVHGKYLFTPVAHSLNVREHVTLRTVKGVPQLERSIINIRTGLVRDSIEPLISNREILAILTNLNNLPKQPQTIYSCRIGQGGAWTGYDSPQRLYRYITEEFEPKDPNTNIDNLISQMSLITYGRIENDWIETEETPFGDI